MTEKLEIRGLSKPSDDLMTITNPDGERFLVFDKKIYPHLELGKIVELEIKRSIPKKSGEGTYNLIRNITVDGQVIGGKTTTGGRQFAGRDEDRTDQRTFVMEVGQDLRAGIIDKTHAFAKAREIILTSWIKPSKSKEVKDETQKKQNPTKAQPDKKTEISQKVSIDEAGQQAARKPVTNAKELMDWAISKGKSYTPSWVRQQTNLGKEVITDKMAVKAFETIKSVTGWD